MYDCSTKGEFPVYPAGVALPGGVRVLHEPLAYGAPGSIVPEPWYVAPEECLDVSGALQLGFLEAGESLPGVAGQPVVQFPGHPVEDVDVCDLGHVVPEAVRLVHLGHHVVAPLPVLRSDGVHGALRVRVGVDGGDVHGVPAVGAGGADLDTLGFEFPGYGFHHDFLVVLRVLHVLLEVIDRNLATEPLQHDADLLFGAVPTPGNGSHPADEGLGLLATLLCGLSFVYI